MHKNKLNVIKLKDLTKNKKGDRMQFNEYVNLLKRKIKADKNNILFLCIGTSDILWDSIGPFVGDYLEKRIGPRYVLGNRYNNICCQSDLEKYKIKIKNKYIVAIDTALTKTNLEGEIFINNKPIILGLGINKNKGAIGNCSIKVCTTCCIDMDYVKNISRFIGSGICEI